jgi:4-amino-4-deoxy-L-arabinose transferase-like glycosyltransferase
VKIKLSTHLLFWLLTLIVFSLVFLATSLEKGMVLDGVVYSTVARNLARGLGSFWAPQYTATVHRAFFEHPPLVFWIQSLFFRVLGDSLFVERIYSFLTAVITGVLIVLIWRLIFRNDRELRRYTWLPLILWSVLSINSWSYSNNLLENTMGIFTLAAIALMGKGIKQHNYFFSIWAGVLIFLAVFCKGPAGFFPAAFYLLAWIVFREMSGRRALINSLLVLFIPLLILSLLLLYPAARDNFARYISYQIVPSLKGDRLLGGETRRFFILKILFIYTLPLTVIAIGVFIYGAIRKRLYLLRSNILRWSLLLILTGFAASLPMIISPKQNYNYLIPSLPYFTLGLGILIVPIINSFLGSTRWREPEIRKAGALLGIILFISLIYSVSRIKEVKSTLLISYKYSIVPTRLRELIFPYAAGRIRREEVFISDIRAIGGRLPRGTIISIPESLWERWNYHAYFSRFYDISLDKDNIRRLYLCEKGDHPPSDKYRLAPLSTQLLDLYWRR